MKVKSAAQMIVLLALVVPTLFGPRAAGLGALRCLRSDRSTDLKTCLSCHDGILASNIKLTDTSSSDPTRNHPVGISYSDAYTRKPDEFVQLSLLDPQLKLVNGEVQCVTCHIGDTNGSWTLVKDGSGPLCLSCHRK